MAKIVENKKGFKVIETSRAEIVAAFDSVGICDYCSDPMFGNPHELKGYLISVLNSWYCPDCYNSFLERTKHYDQDAPIEDRNFARHKKLFGL